MFTHEHGAWQIIKNKPRVNARSESSGGSKKLERMVKMLREELQLHDAICGRTNIVYEEPTDTDLKSIRDQVSSYLTNEELPPQMHTVEYTRAVFKVMRDMILEGGTHTATSMVISPRPDDRPNEPYEPTIGASPARPVRLEMSPAKKTASASPEPAQTESPRPVDNNSYSPAAGASGRASPPPVIKPFITPAKTTKKGDLDRFIMGPGAVQNQALEAAKKRVKERKGAVREITNDINFQKDRIDFLIAQLNNNGGGSPSSPVNTSPRGEDPTKQLRISKQTYRCKMAELKEAKNEIKFETHQKEQCLQNLLAAFEVWERLGEGGEGGGEEVDGSYFEEAAASPSSPDAGEMYARAAAEAEKKVEGRAKGESSRAGLGRSGEWKL